MSDSSSNIPTGDGRVILLTGATGFIGKVALEMLLDRRVALGIDRLVVLIRARKGCDARERFEREIESSECFNRLPAGWSERVDVVDGDITRDGCGISAVDQAMLKLSVTHVMHVAASIEFNLPLDEALAVNTHGALNVLELARSFSSLERMVSVSTAYVNAHPGDGSVLPAAEQLAPLPRPALDIHAELLSGKFDEAELLRESHHPNTYTFTKCLTEHLLVETHGDVPLRIVRPSIVSASWKEPFPGWIDSKAAFVAFVCLAGSGYLKAALANRDALIDLVPVDVVVEDLIAAAFDSDQVDIETGRGIIRHAVSGASLSPTVAQCSDGVVEYFRDHPVGRWPVMRHDGPSKVQFAIADLRHHALPIRFGALVSGKRRAGDRVLTNIREFNRAFPYFTQRSFDFARPEPAPGTRPMPEEYIKTVCGGAYQHLLRGDDTQVPLAGREGPDRGRDISFVRRQPEGDTVYRAAAWLITKVLRRICHLVTFDLDSFDRARATAPENSRWVLVPTHRSYLDFVLCSYLCFARPDLQFRLPYIAAASEFSRIPVLGKLMARLNAFYVDRGLGREDGKLTERVHTLLRERKTFKFYIEGARSRSRYFLEPKRGVVKALQSSGELVAMLPIAISYDRVTEEGSFVQELSGDGKAPMRLTDLFVWCTRAIFGRVQVGRVHIAAGAPVLLDTPRESADVGRAVMAELQKATTVSTFHLNAFLAREPELGMTVDELTEAVRARGGKVLMSPLGAEVVTNPCVQATIHRQLEPQFYPDARLLLAHHPVVSCYLEQHDFRGAEATEAARNDPRSMQFVRAFFEPVCNDFLHVLNVIEGADPAQPLPTPESVVQGDDQHQLPNIQSAYDDLVRRGVLEFGDDGWSLTTGDHDFVDLRRQYAWPNKKGTAGAGSRPVNGALA